MDTIIVTDSIKQNIMLLSELFEQLKSSQIEYDVAVKQVSNQLIVLTALFSAIVLFFTVIITILLPYVLNKLTKRKISEHLKTVNKEISDLKREQTDAIIKTYQTNMRSVRSLYEGKTHETYWKFVWSIRYLEAIRDLLAVSFSQELRNDLITRIKEAHMDLSKTPESQIKSLSKEKLYKGVLDIIKKLSMDEDEEINKESTVLLKSLLNITE